MVVQAFAADLPWDVGFKAAMAALGWSYQIYPYQASTSPATEVQQAIESKPDFIETVGVDPALVKQQLIEARQQHIPIISVGQARSPLTKGNLDYYSLDDDRNNSRQGQLLAQWVVASLAKPVNAVIVTIPGISVTIDEENAIKNVFRSTCSTCASAVLPLAITSLTDGSIPATITAYLQGHPDVNLIMFTVPDESTGVASQLAAVGLLKKIKLVGVAGFGAQIKQLISGTASAWTADPEPYAEWLVADTMARLSEGMPPAPAAALSVMPAFVMTPGNAAQYASNASGWSGPTNYQDSFMKLWHVG